HLFFTYYLFGFNINSSNSCIFVPMKTTFYKVAVTVLLMVLLTPLLKAQEIKVMDNIDASAKAVYFNLTTGQEVAAATKDWDIAFERTTIFVNSGSSGPGNTTALLLKGVTF